MRTLFQREGRVSIKTRILHPTQMRTSASSAFQLKCGLQPAPHSNLNANFNRFRISTQTRACELHISITEQNP